MHARGVSGEIHREWMDLYNARGYVKVDPAGPLAVQSLRPFTYSEIEYLHEGKLGKELYAERRRVYCDDAILIPVHGPLAEVGVVILTGDGPTKISDQDVPLLMRAARSFVDPIWLADTIKPDSMLHRRLSTREQQCLYWLSEGKSAPVIGEILGISPHTVHQYISACMMKLQVTSREALVRRALAAGRLVGTPET